MPPHLEFSSTEVEVDSANKFFFTELAFGKEREDTTALVCAESAEANGATPVSYTHLTLPTIYSV